MNSSQLVHNSIFHSHQRRNEDSSEDIGDGLADEGAKINCLANKDSSIFANKMSKNALKYKGNIKQSERENFIKRLQIQSQFQQRPRIKSFFGHSLKRIGEGFKLPSFKRKVAKRESNDVSLQNLGISKGSTFYDSDRQSFIQFESTKQLDRFLQSKDVRYLLRSLSKKRNLEQCHNRNNALSLNDREESKLPEENQNLLNKISSHRAIESDDEENNIFITVSNIMAADE